MNLGKNLSVAKIRKAAIFFGRKTTALLFLGIFVGIGLFAIELVLAFGLQAFLISIHVANTEAVKLPSWWPSTSLRFVLTFILTLGVLRGLLQWLQLYAQGAAEQYATTLQRSRLITWAFRSQSASSAEVTHLFGEVAIRTCAAFTAMQSLVIQASSSLLLGISLFFLVPSLTAIIIFVLAVLFFAMRKIDEEMRISGIGVAKEQEKTVRRLLVSIRNLLLLQIQGTLREEEEKAQSSLSSYLKHILAFYKFSGFKQTVVQIIGVGIVCGTTLIGYKLLGLKPGMLITYFYLLMRFLQSVSQSSIFFSSLMNNLPHLQILATWWADKSFDGVRNRKSFSKTSDTTPFPQPIGWKLDNLSFTYPGASHPTIKDLSLDIKPGETWVIMGKSGSGKSTLLNILLGNLEPSSGRVGINLADGKEGAIEPLQERLLASVGYVGPESFLIEGSLLANLTYGLPETPSAVELERCLRLAECDFVFSLPGYLDYPITEQGQGLSAGQKQRISLARALLRKPKALILDEATSNLDEETEHRLLLVFQQLKGSMTIIAVSHRQSLLMIADRHINFRSESTEII